MRPLPFGRLNYYTRHVVQIILTRDDYFHLSTCLLACLLTYLLTHLPTYPCTLALLLLLLRGILRLPLPFLIRDNYFHCLLHH